MSAGKELAAQIVFIPDSNQECIKADNSIMLHQNGFLDLEFFAIPLEIVFLLDLNCASASASSPGRVPLALSDLLHLRTSTGRKQLKKSKQNF